MAGVPELTAKQIAAWEEFEKQEHTLSVEYVKEHMEEVKKLKEAGDEAGLNALRAETHKKSVEKLGAFLNKLWDDFLDKEKGADGTLPQEKAKEVVEDFLIAHKQLTLKKTKLIVNNDIIYQCSEEDAQLKKISEAGGEEQAKLEKRIKEEMAAAYKVAADGVSAAYDELFFGEKLDTVTKEVLELEDLAEGAGITKNHLKGITEHMIKVLDKTELMERFNKKVNDASDAAVTKIKKEFIPGQALEDDGLPADANALEDKAPKPRRERNCCVDLFDM